MYAAMGPPRADAAHAVRQKSLAVAAASIAAAAAQAGVPASMLTDHKAKGRRCGVFYKVENALADRAKKMGISVEKLDDLLGSI